MAFFFYAESEYTSMKEKTTEGTTESNFEDEQEGEAKRGDTASEDAGRY
jgi:hypothetical protein